MYEYTYIMLTGQILLNQYTIIFKSNSQQSVFNKFKFLLLNVTGKKPQKTIKQNQTLP